jgi:hypothetical protein
MTLEALTFRKSKVSALTVSACNFCPPDTTPETTPIPLASVAGAAGAGAGAAGAKHKQIISEICIITEESYSTPQEITWSGGFNLGSCGLLCGSLWIL